LGRDPILVLAAGRRDHPRKKLRNKSVTDRKMTVKRELEPERRGRRKINLQGKEPENKSTLNPST